MSLPSKRSILFSLNFLAVCGLLTVPNLALAQNGHDAHLATKPAGSLFQQSPWVHGYMHGYEWGYHNGNLDLHMMRGFRDPKKIKDHEKVDYRPEYGDRKDFAQGFKSGLDVGYADAYQGKEFRAATLARESAGQLQAGPALTLKPHDLDSAISTGYKQGRDIGLNDGRLKNAYADRNPDCPAQSTCEPFRVGFRWGYSDGYYNQRQPDDLRRAASK